MTGFVLKGLDIAKKNLENYILSKYENLHTSQKSFWIWQDIYVIKEKIFKLVSIHLRFI